MAIRVGINGFGRIGRLAFRAMRAQGDKFDVVAVNDLAPPESLAHLVKYDTVHRKYPGTVEVCGQGIKVDGDEVKILSERSPANLPWGDLGVDFVIESTGIFRKAESEKGGYGDHIKAGAKCVILSAPAGDDKALLSDASAIGSKVVRTVVLGVNDNTIKKGDKYISNASCTTNCLAPVAKVLQESFGIERGLMTTIHAPTNDQVIQDAIHKDLRRARGGFENIIPTTTGAARAVGLVLPVLNGKLDGFALRVPVMGGSCVDLTAELSKSATAEAINEAVKAAANGALKGILEYCDEPIVSGDIIGNPASSIFDALCTLVGNKDSNFIKIVSWYDNEWGYSNRTADLIAKIASL
ncbi:MAG: type I glyceraldehyde-3-phosphate dehydrogenase [Phycisphaerae bacterium]|nr:type I glyceraldehyde-3-phosphate dehydrogenase [Phycisphaerae bacterium]